jgi:hypothetical protein
MMKLIFVLILSFAGMANAHALPQGAGVRIGSPGIASAADFANSLVDLSPIGSMGDVSAYSFEQLAEANPAMHAIESEMASRADAHHTAFLDGHAVRLPESETWWLIALGFALIGMQAHRGHKREMRLAA